MSYREKPNIDSFHEEEVVLDDDTRITKNDNNNDNFQELNDVYGVKENQNQEQEILWDLADTNKKKKKETGDFQDNLVELELIAQRVGGDLGMQVKLGKPGEGSFYDPDRVTITLDPDHVRQNPNEAKFVTAHEGAHRAISKSPHEIGLPIDKINEYYSQLGFGYIQNAIEDPAVNNWFKNKFPGLKEFSDEVYNNQFTEEGAVLSTPEVQKIAQQLGYWPKFAKFGSEVIRNWHQKRFSHNLDKDVLEVLEKTRLDFEESIMTIPGNDIKDNKKVIKKARERFSINTEKVWPEVKKLIDKDINNENLRQQAQEAYEKIKEMEELQEQMSQAGSKGAGNKQNKKVNKKDDGIGKDFNEGVNGDVQKKQENGGNKQGTDNIGDRIEKLKQDLESQGFSSEVLDEIKEKIEQSKKEVQSKGGKDKENDKEKEELHNNFGDPVPVDQLSKQTKKALQDAYNKLPKDQKDRIEQESKKILEDFEDELNKEIGGKLNREKAASHEKQRENTNKNDYDNKNDYEKKQKKKNEEQHEQIKERLKEMVDSSMTDYEKIRSEQMFMIDSLYLRLKQILHPDEEGKDESGYPSGYKPDLVRAMQSDADVSQKTKMWFREDEPEIKDYRFWHLVDMSGSMGGNPLQEVYKGFVTICEAVNRVEDFNSDKVNIHQGVSGFSNVVYKYKRYDERLTSSMEKKLSKMLVEGGGGTDTYSATSYALKEMEKDTGKTGNFLLTFTDGSPDNIDLLANLIKTTKQERDKKKIKIGIVWLTNSGDHKQAKKELNELIEECGYDFGLTMSTGEFSENRETHENRNFSERLADLLEDILNHPEKY